MSKLAEELDTIAKAFGELNNPDIKPDSRKQTIEALKLQLSTLIGKIAGMKKGGAKGNSKDKRKKKGGADINFDTMGGQIMNTGGLLDNPYMANLVPTAWSGPSPFSAGNTLPETITKGLPDTLVNAMDPPLVRGGGKKKSSSKKSSGSKATSSKNKK